MPGTPNNLYTQEHLDKLEEVMRLVHESHDDLRAIVTATSASLSEHRARARERLAEHDALVIALRDRLEEAAAAITATIEQARLARSTRPESERPWVRLGISKATYYRRKARETE